MTQAVVEEVGELIVFQSPFRTHNHLRRGGGEKTLDGHTAADNLHYPDAEIKIYIGGVGFYRYFTSFPKRVKGSAPYNLELMELDASDGKVDGPPYCRKHIFGRFSGESGNQMES